MGTFHDTKDPLHGITVVAQSGDTVYVGRCHARENGHIVLLDVDQHYEGEGGRTNQAYLERAARFGVWKKHEKLVLEAAAVTALTPLADHFLRPGATTADATAGVPAAPALTAAAAAVATPAEPGPVAANPEAPVQLTDAAVTEVQRLLAAPEAAGKGLRLAVSGGGCSGLVYKVEFDERKPGDLIVASDGFDVLLDRKSTIYLRGVVLDHQAGLSGRGFQFQNPNASNTCGCGESFSV